MKCISQCTLYACGQTDRQTHKQAHHNTPLPYQRPTRYNSTCKIFMLDIYTVQSVADTAMYDRPLGPFCSLLLQSGRQRSRILWWVCLSSSMHAYIKDHVWTSPNFLCMLRVDVALSSSAGIVICGVLPVLWATCFPIMSSMPVRCSTAALLHCYAQTNTPAAWYVLVVYCPRWWWVPRLDGSFMQGVRCITTLFIKL